MLSNVFSKTIYDRQRSFMWWSLGVAVMILIMILFYPTIRDNDDMLKLLEGMPKEMLALAGISDAAAMMTPAGYLQGRLFSMLLPLLLLVFAIGFGTRAIAGEEEARTIDMLLSHPVRRSQVVLQSFGAMVALLAGLGVVIVLALFLSALTVDMEIGVDKLVAGTVSSVLLALFFGTLGLALGAATGKRGLSMGLTSTVAIVGYLVHSLGEAVDWLKPAQKFSPFYYATSSNPLTNGLDLGHSLVFVVAMALLVAVAVFTFERRDVAV
ncbi:MAG: ABC transporter permease subunit [Herpetosiphonaceae bacterium]|nr:ABC transporter permease subunit [Herpetosiphonaceae bacterium]